MERPFEQRHALNLNQTFGPLVGDFFESFPNARGKNNCFHLWLRPYLFF
jgi:hypothetical protein